MATDDRPLTSARERGAMLVEFALLFPILAILGFGLLSVVTAYEQNTAIAAAARDGATYGAGLSLSEPATGGTWATNVRDIMAARAGSALGGRKVHVCVSLVEGSAGSGSGVVVVGPGEPFASPHDQSWYTTNEGPDGTMPTPCDPRETYATTPNDAGPRVQVRISKPGKLDVMLFSVKITLTSRATSRYQAVAGF